ncbi:MAG TPA: IS110 family transposase, partial [Pyrinomonadaceae bacterium]|nr:IS110 family transposase [Pyrinomonadaceae bacterium]
MGIDLHKNSSQVCILTEDGELIERRIKTDKESFDKLFAETPPARILVEASAESEWAARHFESLGYEVIVADPNFAPMYATRDRRIKTDKRDARALCEACRLGAYRPTHRTSDRKRDIRAHLAVRETLVRIRSKYISLIGALARREGCRIEAGPSPIFARRVAEAGLPTHTLMQIEPLLVMLKALNEQIKSADKRLEEIVKADEVVQRLCSVPGVGPVVATTFAATLDDASRLLGAKHVRSYLGLVSREHSSGEGQRRGRISKAGSARAKSLMVEAAWSLLRWKTERTKALHEWWARIAQRRGKATAVVALARKLAGIMFAVWRDGTEFDPLLL